MHPSVKVVSGLVVAVVVPLIGAVPGLWSTLSTFVKIIGAIVMSTR